MEEEILLQYIVFCSVLVVIIALLVYSVIKSRMRPSPDKFIKNHLQLFNEKNDISAEVKEDKKDDIIQEDKHELADDNPKSRRQQGFFQPSFLPPSLLPYGYRQRTDLGSSNSELLTISDVPETQSNKQPANEKKATYHKYDSIRDEARKLFIESTEKERKEKEQKEAEKRKKEEEEKEAAVKRKKEKEAENEKQTAPKAGLSLSMTKFPSKDKAAEAGKTPSNGTTLSMKPSLSTTLK